MIQNVFSVPNGQFYERKLWIAEFILSYRGLSRVINKIKIILFIF